MPGIYLSNDANCSKSLLTVEKLAQSLLPRCIVFTRSLITRKGYRFDFTQESDVNLFFFTLKFWTNFKKDGMSGRPK